MNLSIILPVYNVEKYLSQCLDSVLVDNSFTGQVICVNDGSTDSSLAILKHYAEKYCNIEIVSQQNAGLSAARNAGFDRATGDYVFFLDSDDWVFPNSINCMMSHVVDEEVIYFNAELFYENNQCLSGKIDIPTLRNVDGATYFEAIYGKRRNMPAVCVCGGIYRRSFLAGHNLYHKQGVFHEDNYFTPQVLLAAKKVSSINEYVYAYRIREGSISAHVTEKHIRDLFFVARNLYTIYAQKGEVADVFYSDVSGIYTTIIEKAYNNGIDLQREWRITDSKMMLRGADNKTTHKMAVLTFITPHLAYQYLHNTIPVLLRKLINRCL